MAQGAEATNIMEVASLEEIGKLVEAKQETTT